MAPRSLDRSQNVLYKSFFFIFLSVLLIFFESRFEQARLLRQTIHYLLSPVYLTLDLSIKQRQRLRDHLVFTSAQNRRLARLEHQTLRLTQELLAARRLNEEQRTLKQTLASSPADIASIPARVIGQTLSINNQQIIVDKGSIQGVGVGMPVMGNNGLAGQVVLAGLATARVLLITDLRHSTPVMNARNRHRFLLNGGGEADKLYAKDVGSYIDVRDGDLLITSGLGERFPSGLPVARVTEVVRRPELSFFTVHARPLIKPYTVSFLLIHPHNQTVP